MKSGRDNPSCNIQRVDRQIQGNGCKQSCRIFTYALSVFAWAVIEAREGRRVCSIDPNTHTIRFVDIKNIFKQTREKAHFAE